MPFGVGELDAQFAPTNKWTPALSKSVVITGNVLCYGFSVFSTNAAAQWVYVFDAVSAPANGTVPVYALAIGATSDREVAYLPPREFLQGIVLANSTSGSTFTAGAADCAFDVQFQTLA